MLRIVYSSVATKPFSGDELLDLLDEARRSNELMDVTGMLLYRHGKFLQVLEGAEATVESLFEKISTDPRHHTCKVLDREIVERREFGDWSMGFENLDEVEAGEIPGATDFLTHPFDSDFFQQESTRAMTLLNLFKVRV